MDSAAYTMYRDTRPGETERLNNRFSGVNDPTVDGDDNRPRFDTSDPRWLLMLGRPS